MSKLRDLILSIPLGVRLVIRDAIEGAIAAVVALNLAIPSTLSEAHGEALIAITAVAGAVVAVLRREALPAISSWLLGLFSPTPPAPPAG